MKSISTPLLVTVIVLSSQLAGGAIRPGTSVFCTPSQASSKFESFSFDLYPMGHPMRGVTMYSGLFLAKSADLFCHDTYGFIKTSVGSGRTLIQEGTSNCLHPMEFVLNVHTDLYSKNPSSAELTYRTTNPLFSGQPTTVELTCVETE